MKIITLMTMALLLVGCASDNGGLIDPAKIGNGSIDIGSVSIRYIDKLAAAAVALAESRIPGSGQMLASIIAPKGEVTLSEDELNTLIELIREQTAEAGEKE